MAAEQYTAWEVKMKIYILRHGETDSNVKKIAQGRSNVPLNKNGRDLAVLTGQGIKGIRFDHCISSPLVRARETAELVLEESGNDIPIVIDDRIIEIDFGEKEGKSLTEMTDTDYLFYKDPLQHPGFPGGEAITDVCKRTQAFLNELIAKDDGKTYLISTHGCAMRAMTNFLFDDPANFWRGHAPYNCSFTIIDAVNGAATITDVDKVYYDPDLVVDLFK